MSHASICIAVAIKNTTTLTNLRKISKNKTLGYLNYLTHNGITTYANICITVVIGKHTIQYILNKIEITKSH